MIRNIYVHHSLEKIAGKNLFVLDCNDQNTMVAALASQEDKLGRALRNAEVKILGIDPENERAEPIQADFNFGTFKDIHVIPSVSGEFFIPAVIVAYGVYAEIAYSIAMAVLLAYVAQKLAPKPKVGSNGAGGPQSTLFNGPVNSTDQGGPIPIIYGKKVLVGTTVIAADADYFNIA